MEPVQVVPSGAVGFVQVPVAGWHEPATWQVSSAVHVTGFEPMQVPLRQESVCVQRFPSLQVVPFAAEGFEHTPVLGLHVPATWHGSIAVQTTVAPAVQTPAWHMSFESQRLPSLHAAPLLTLEYCVVLTAGWHVWHVVAPFVAPDATHAPLIEQKPALSVGAVHTPVDVLHVPGLWQESGAVQVTVLPAVQTPVWHVSFRSQAFPSLHAVPLAAVGLEHWPVLELHVPAT